MTHRDTPWTIVALALGVASVSLLGLRLFGRAPSRAGWGGVPPQETFKLNYGTVDPKYVPQQPPGSPKHLPGRRRFPDLALNRGVTPDLPLWNWGKHRPTPVPLKTGLVPDKSLWSWLTHRGTIAVIGGLAALLAFSGAGSAATHNGLLGQCATSTALPLSGGFVLGLLGLIGSFALRPGGASLVSASTGGATSGGTTFVPQGSGTAFDPSGSGNTFDASGSGNTFDPSGSGNTFDPQGAIGGGATGGAPSGGTFAPQGSGTTFDPSGSGNTFHPSGSGNTLDASGSGNPLDLSGSGNTFEAQGALGSADTEGGVQLGPAGEPGSADAGEGGGPEPGTAAAPPEAEPPP